MPESGYASTGFFVLTVLLAAVLRAVAPHVAAPAGKIRLAPTPTEATV